ncbi:MAG: 2-dehydro-3-deoxygalactonokinase [Sporomusaceae bacterium]|nr:2-dehydro-3-deoxygalactonokinase [Sporomusaceae bacterium]
MLAVIDCGTTNTRVYILTEEGGIAGQSAEKVGVRDVASTGTKQVLQEGIKKAFLQAINHAGVELSQVRFAIASGMITSEIGLIDLPHLVAPAGLDELAASVKTVKDQSVFPLDVPVVFVRGIRNAVGEGRGLGLLRQMDFMRGEEVQVMGILADRRPKLPFNVVVLSSHTKLINVNERGQITGSITTISGQFYEALQSTSIGKSIRPATTVEPVGGYPLTDIVNAASESVTKAGFLRTMLMPRFMQVLISTNWAERQQFVDAAIAACDMEIFAEFGRLGFPNNVPYLLVGHKERCEIYELLLKRTFGPECEVEYIYDQAEIDRFTVTGAFAVADKVNPDN